MNQYTARVHQLTARDYEGYGVYAGVGQTSTFQMPGIPNLPSPADAMMSAGGIQVLRPEFVKPAIDLLGQTTLQLDPSVTASDPMQTGQASVVFGQLGSGWANDYVSRGYAVMVDVESVQSGAPLVILANAPSYIADSASDGDAYVVVSGPPALIAAAAALVNGGNGVVIEPPEIDFMCPSGATIDYDSHPPVCRDASGKIVAPVNGKAAAEAPAWMWPAIIGVGALVLVGGVMAMKK